MYLFVCVCGRVGVSKCETIHLHLQPILFRVGLYYTVMLAVLAYNRGHFRAGKLGRAVLSTLLVPSCEILLLLQHITIVQAKTCKSGGKCSTTTLRVLGGVMVSL
jgi:hypothetical protein